MTAQLALPWPYVTVSCVSLERVDERTGKPFAWSYRLTADVAWPFVVDINAGRQLDPFGRPWPRTAARVVH